MPQLLNTSDHGALTNSESLTPHIYTLTNGRIIPAVTPHGIDEQGNITQASNLIGPTAANALALTYSFRLRGETYPKHLQLVTDAVSGASVKADTRRYIFKRLERQLFGKFDRQDPRLHAYLQAAKRTADTLHAFIRQHAARCHTHSPELQYTYDLIKQLMNTDWHQFRVCLTDKNLGLAAVSRTWYNRALLEHLDNPDVYKLVHPLVPMSKMPQLIQALQRTPYVHPRMYKLSTYKQLPKFHLLPKLHKTPLSVRPICGAHSWITTPFSKGLAIAIQQCMDSSVGQWLCPQVLSDTDDFVHLMFKWRDRWMPSHPTQPHALPQWPVSHTLWLVTADVSALYTTMPLRGAALAWAMLDCLCRLPLSPSQFQQPAWPQPYTAIQQWMYQAVQLIRRPGGWKYVELQITSRSTHTCAPPVPYRERLQQRFNEVLLLNEANYFQVKIHNPDTHQTRVHTYQQLDGLAMGTNAAPQLANIWLALLEFAAIRPHMCAHPSEPSGCSTEPSILHYSRFIDDVFILSSAPSSWTASQVQRHFTQMLNGLDRSIRMSIQAAHTVQFLDVELHHQSQPPLFYWHAYTKPINAFLYIPVHSNHPRAMYKGLYIGTAHRLAGRSSDRHLYDIALTDAARIFHARKHNLRRIQRLWRHVSYEERIQQLLTTRPRLRPHRFADDNAIYVILPFDSRLPIHTLAQEIVRIWNCAGQDVKPMLAWLGRRSLGQRITTIESKL